MSATFRNSHLICICICLSLISTAGAEQPTPTVAKPQQQTQSDQPRTTQATPAKPADSPLHRYVVIDENDNYALIDKTGKIVARTEIAARGNKSVGHMVFDFERGIAPYRVGTSYGWLDAQGNVVVEPEFDRLGTVQEGYVPVQINGRWGLYTVDGEVAVPARFDTISAVSEGIALFATREPDQFQLTEQERSRVESLIDDLSSQEFSHREKATEALVKFGERAAPLLQEAALGDDIEVAARAKALLTELKKKGDPQVHRLERPVVGAIDVQGNIIIPPRFASIVAFSEGLALARLSPDEKLGYIDTKGQCVIKPQFDWGYEFHEGKALVRINGQYELRNRKNETVLQIPQGLTINAFHSCPQRLVVKKNNHVGFMDRSGNIIGDIAYDEVGSFHEGLAKVRVGNRWGYANLKSEIAIKPQFSVAFDFKGPLAKFRTKDHWGFVNQQGEIVYRWSE